MDAELDKKKDLVVIGHITNPHGVKGWVRIYSETDPRLGIFDYQPWMIGKDNRVIRVLQGRKQGKHLVAELQGVSDRETAESLGEQQIAIFREQLPELEESRYYWADLIGLNVVTLTGQGLGTIKQMIATGANDVMQVSGDRERLIPFIDKIYIKRVDFVEKSVEVDWDPDF
jgi:16S rRNA processing protein RimM